MDPVEQERRQLLFTPLETMEDLHAWIRYFLGVDLPDCVVDEQSTSSPMHVIWEVYDHCRRNEELPFDSYLSYAARASFKTLGAAILEVLMLYPLGRNVAHMAAIETQAQKAAEYVKKFLRRTTLRDFVVGSNKRQVEVVRYENPKTGEILSTAQWEALVTDAERDRYEMHSHYHAIVVCTMAGANSQHVNFFCVGGDTQVLSRSLRTSNRTRQVRTARGLFNAVAGLEPSGRPVSIGLDEPQIVAARQLVELWSFDFGTGEFSFKPIVQACRRRAETLRVETVAGDLVCTLDHPFFVIGRGFTEAKDLRVGDCVLRIDRMKGTANHRRDRVLESDAAPDRGTTKDPWVQVLLGSLLGDGGVYRKPMNNAHFKEQHCPEQAGYLKWKVGILSQKVRFREVPAISGYTGQALVGYASGNSPLFNGWEKFRKDPELGAAHELDALGLAVWYMDDGCHGNSFKVSSESFTREQNQKLADVLFERFGIEASPHCYTKSATGATHWYLLGGVEAKRRLAEICAPYVHPDLAYKFDISNNWSNCKWCGKKFWFYEAGLASKRCRDQVCRLLQKKIFHLDQVQSVAPEGEKVVYDFTVEGNHNFFANQFLVKNCVDEIDVVNNPAAYEESKAIPDVQDDKLPVTLYTSTRKFSVGLVQDEINRSHETGLQVRHWNIIDVTQKCPSTRHLPMLSKIPIYRSDDTLRAVSAEDYQAMPQETQEKYVRDEGFQGCLSNCKLFAVCKGRLATHQKSDSPMLKKIAVVQSQFRKFSSNMAKAQLLCWKPSTEGLVYPRLDRGVHFKTAAQIAQMVTGEVHDPKMSKAQLVALMMARNVQWYAGMDHGFTHAFATVVGFRDGARMFVIEAIAQVELELGQKIELLDRRVRVYDPTVFADPEAPDVNKTLRRHGFRLVKWDKGPGSVLGGIEAMRLKMWPAIGEPELYFLAEDEEVDLLFTRLQEYRWKLNEAQQPTKTPDDTNDDLPDAARYLVMNVFAPKGRLVIEGPDRKAAKKMRRVAEGKGPTVKEIQAHNWAQVLSVAGVPAPVHGMVQTIENPEDIAEGEGGPRRKRRGFVWSI